MATETTGPNEIEWNSQRGETEERVNKTKRKKNPQKPSKAWNKWGDP